MGLKFLPAVTCTTTDTAYQVTTSGILAHRVYIWQKPGNSGVLYVGSDNTLKPSTDTGVAGVLPIPTNNINQPFIFGEETAPNGQNLANIWISSSNGGDKAYVGYYES